MSKLYIIGTPIGNLDDITYRAVETMRAVDFIICEDTRVTDKLLKRYGILKPLLSYHSQSKLKKLDVIIALLAEGKSLALVSDAGTPAISDPGSVLVSEVRKRLPSDVEIVPIPGPSAVATLLSAAGIPASEFTFFGFLPHKKGRQTIFGEIAGSERTSVFYESPHRFDKAMESLFEILDTNRIVAVGRELTKIYEEIKVGTIVEVHEYYEKNKDKVRGEFVVAVAPLHFHF